MCNGESMGLLGGISARRSCRAYKKTPLSPELLRSVLEYATYAPSAKNMQPWEVYVVAGAKLDELREANRVAFRTKNTAPMEGGTVPPALKSRARQLSADMTEFLERQNWSGERSFVQRSIEFFDAPAAAIVCVDSPKFVLDAGLFVQTLCLSATGHGLGSCVLGYPLIVKPAIREFLQLPPERMIVTTVALGFAADEPMAQFESSRAELDENVRFIL